MNIKLFKRKEGLFRLISIFAILTLTLIACQPSPTSTQPEAPTQRLSTPSAPTDTAVPATLTPDIPGTITAEVPATITPQVSSALQIRQLRMIDAKTGWAGATGNRILHTTQGVQSWEDVSPPYPEGDFSVAAFFFDRETAFLVTTQMIPLPNEMNAQVVPWRTTDGGKTWKEGETVSIEHVAPFFPAQLYFLNKKHGWLLAQQFMSMGTCEANILETRDGGFHYDLIYRTSEHLNEVYQTSEHFIESSAFYGTCLRTFGSETMSFVSDSTGFASSNYEQLVGSKDGGHTWQHFELERPGDYPHLSFPVSLISAPLFSSDRDGVLSVRVYDETQRADTPYAVFHGLPQAQYLYYTHDAGQSWLTRPAPARIGTLSFLNARMGWFLGKDDPTPSAGTQLYLTSDGGETWSLIAADSPLPLGTEIQFIDGQNGFAYNPFTGSQSAPGIDANHYHELDSRSGSESYLFTSKDSGRSWSPVEPQLAP